MARKSDTKEIKKETFIQTSRRGGDGQPAERTCVAVAGQRLAECGMNGAGSLTTGRPCGPTVANRYPRGPDSEWLRMGQAEQRVVPHGPTFTHR